MANKQRHASVFYLNSITQHIFEICPLREWKTRSECDSFGKDTYRKIVVWKLTSQARMNFLRRTKLCCLVPNEEGLSKDASLFPSELIALSDSEKKVCMYVYIYIYIYMRETDSHLENV